MGGRLTAGGAHFSVWAPEAQFVSVIGDFNDWKRSAHPLKVRGNSGIWEGFVPAARKGQVYKFHVASRHRLYRVDKADPFAIRAEAPPRSARSMLTVPVKSPPIVIPVEP